MGSPRQPRKTYSTPLKIWSKARLESERPFIREFGLKNKAELWRTESVLRKYTGQAKRLIALRGSQADIEQKQMMDRLSALGVIEKNASLDEVLGLTIKDFLARRLQTLVFKKNLSRSIGQARQFIVHRHVRVGGRIVTSPSFLVPLASEGEVAFVERSAISKPDHPERAVAAKKEVPDPVDVAEAAEGKAVSGKPALKPSVKRKAEEKEVKNAPAGN